MNKARPTLRDWGEDRVVAALTKALPSGPDVVTAAGDDCAVLGSPDDARWQLLKTDVVVEGVHFLRDAPPAAVGWKAAARAVSDIAAMAGRPRAALVTVVVPADREVAWLTGLYRGLSRAARELGFSIVGGETSSVAPGAPAMVNVALTGTVRRELCLLRSGGRAGDALFVTGRLGGSLGGRHLRFRPRLDEAEWLATHFRPTAMMDLSDGVGKDLPRLAAASGTGWELDVGALPRHRGCTVAQALGDGEDFELLFAVAPEATDPLRHAWQRRFPEVPLTGIGRLRETAVREPRLDGRGWDHFALTPPR